MDHDRYCGQHAVCNSCLDGYGAFFTESSLLASSVYSTRVLPQLRTGLSSIEDKGVWSEMPTSLVHFLLQTT